MAPRGRRGGRRASAAVSARGQWKVGDLVLAKIRGFPAWPATVSEPEKWGQTTDLKKVFVLFFGTKEIAFCNPRDLEAFTAEKKKPLLAKCQRKGADFSLAVEEIIDCFDMSKMRDEADVLNSGDEGSVSNAGTQGSMDKSMEKSLTRSPNISVEVPVVAPETAVRQDSEAVSEEPIGSTLVPDLPIRTRLDTSNSRKRSREKPVQNCSIKKKLPSVRNSGNSNTVDSSKFESLIMAVNDVHKKNDVASDVVQNEPIGSNRRISETLHETVSSDAISPVRSAACASISSSEDNASEIVATDSDAVSLNEAGVSDSSCSTKHLDTTVDYSSKDAPYDETLLVCGRTFVVRKKRKPNRKRLVHHPAEVTIAENESGEVGGDEVVPSLPIDAGKLGQMNYKADGDEHLPLVKRARARLGKPFIDEKDTNILLDTEENSSKGAMDQSEPVLVPSLSALACKASLVDQKEPENNTPAPTSSSHCIESSHLSWIAKKCELRGYSEAAEANLPPSKRLHRALEAMCANAAEDDQENHESQKTTMISISNGCTSSDKKSPLHTTMENEARDELEVHISKHSCDDVRNMSGRSRVVPLLTSPSCERPEEIFSEVRPGEFILENSISPKLEDCQEISAQNSLNTTDINVSFFNARCETEVCVKALQPSHFSAQCGEAVYVETSQPTSISGEKHDSLDSASGMISPTPAIKEEVETGLLIPSNQSFVNVSKGDIGNILADKSEGKTGQKSKVWSPNSVSEAKDIKCVSPVDGTSLFSSVTSGSSRQDNKSSEPPPDGNTKVEGMCEIVKEVDLVKDAAAPSGDTSNEGLISANYQAKRHFHATSLHGDFMDNKIVSDTKHSPITRITDYSEKVSSRHFPIFHQPTLNNSNYILHNGSGSPKVPSNSKKTTDVLEMEKEGKLEEIASNRHRQFSKWTRAEVYAARKSFQVWLGTLSRTKESISRATRLAIDCAKYGIADEVIEILARSLEKESSLYRRVDLFFLVDSIIQRSRGQKGNIGEIYTSAVRKALPRLLSAAAPPGSDARENRRQCLKVLKLWLERKILPESIIRHHMHEIDDAVYLGSSSQRALRTDRSVNDPVREMEGMLVDEYGSNANFQLPGIFMPHMLENGGGSDNDEQSFEAVTPEPEIPVEGDTAPTSTTERNHHILENVDGKREIKDIIPSSIADVNSSYNSTRVDSVRNLDSQFEQGLPLSLPAPPLHENKPPAPSPLTSSPPSMPSLHSFRSYPTVPTPHPPFPPQPPSFPFSRHSFADNADSINYTNTRNVSSGFQQPTHLQQGAPPVNTMISDSVDSYAPGYRDFGPRMQRPGFPSSSQPIHSFHFPNTSMGTQNNVQQIDVAPNKNYHLPPPPRVLSNQFSYVRPDQRANTWMEAPTSSSTKSFQFRRDVYAENMNDNQDRKVLDQCGTGDRCTVPPPVHPGPIHSDIIDSSYVPAPLYASHPEIPDRQWSYPPKAFNYRHHTPLQQPETSGANGGPNLWRSS